MKTVASNRTTSSKVNDESGPRIASVAMMEEQHQPRNLAADSFSMEHNHGSARSVQRQLRPEIDANSDRTGKGPALASLPMVQTTSVLGICDKRQCPITPRAELVEDVLSKITLCDIFHCYYHCVYWDLPVIDMRTFEQLLVPGAVGEVEVDLVVLDAITLLAIPHISRSTLLCLSYESRWSAEKALTDKVKVCLASLHLYSRERAY
jgi:hypothetical protein